ncbi:MAG TPA: LLM class flavin-dependent oxidoreductase [Candidatus Limnocylindrales bacterium]|nr:LLM class flavin-dependent oxidoreductase [Candidatus Limnocylindrales bacterium]
MSEVRLGVNLWSQASDWPTFLEAARRAETLGYDHLWTWDHVYAIFGDPYQPVFEGYTALAALAQATHRIRLGLFVAANTFRNPGVAVKALTTIDHVSGGRAIMGMGGAWFEKEHSAFGIDFGDGFGQRLDWLAEAVSATRTLLDGGEVTSEPGGRYAFDALRISPPPIQGHVPIMIGGGGEKKTLRIVAEYADMWNVFGTPESVARKAEILDRHCAEVGRDPTEIERTLGCKPTIRATEAEAQRVYLDLLERNRTPLSRMEGDDSVWVGTPDQVAERMLAYREVGFHSFIAELAAPYDAETMESLANVVKPMVESVPA